MLKSKRQRPDEDEGERELSDEENFNSIEFNRSGFNKY